MNYKMLKVKKGDKVVKVLTGAGFRTASYQEVTGVRNHGQIILLNDETDVSAGVNAYNAITRQAVASYIPGFSTMLLTEEEAKAEKDIEFEE